MDSAKQARWKKVQEKKAEHKPISNQKGSNIRSLSKTIENNWFAEQLSPLASKGAELEMVDNTALPSDAANPEVNISHDYYQF